METKRTVAAGAYRRGGLRHGVGLLLEARAAVRAAKAEAVDGAQETLLGLYARLGHLIRAAAGPGEGGRRRLGPLIAGLAQPLERLYGRSFGADNLERMVRFSRGYPGARERRGLKGLDWTQVAALLPPADSAPPRKKARTGPSQPGEPRLDRACAELLGCGDAELDRRDALIGRLEAYLLSSEAGLGLCERHRRFVAGDQGFELDLLFFHRGLRRLFAVLARTEPPSPGLKDPLPFVLLWLEQNLRQPGEGAPVGMVLDPFQAPAECAVRGLDGAVVPWHRSGLPPKAVLRDFFRRSLEEARLGRGGA